MLYHTILYPFEKSLGPVTSDMAQERGLHGELGRGQALAFRLRKTAEFWDALKLLNLLK